MKVTGLKMELINTKKKKINKYRSIHVIHVVDPELPNFCLPFHSCLVEGIAIHS